MASLIEGYDRDIPLRLVPRLDPRALQTGGFSTILDASTRYSRRTNRVELGANAASAIRHYGTSGETQSVGHSAGVGANVRLQPRTSLFANQSASYTPPYFYGLMLPGLAEIEPGDAASTRSDFAVGNGQESVNYVSTVRMGHELARRRSVNIGGEYLYTDRLHETEDWRDVSLYSLRGGYSFSPTRNTGLSGNIQYRSGDMGYKGHGKTTELGLNVRWNYTRPLSATRSLQLGISVGVSGTDLQQVAGGVDVLRRRYQGTGDARISFPLGATWQVTGNFRRGLDYVVDLPTPVYNTAANVGAQGLLTSRFDVSASAGYSRGAGASALNANSLQYDTYSGIVRGRYAINQMVATYVEYLYYYYDFRGATELLQAGIPPGLERNGIRVGLTLWVPALRR
jgi:hypothetical protein